MSVNSKLIRELRHSLNWTQVQLAKKAGYTERLISKLESGKPVAASTIQDIGDAFREAGLEVTEAELSFNPEALARRFIESMYRYKKTVIDECMDFLHRDAVFIFAGDPSVFPFAGRHEGIAAGRIAFQSFFTILEPPSDNSELDRWEYLSTGRGALAWGDSWIHPIGQPMSDPVRIAVRYEFEGGLLKFWEDRFDTQAGAKVIEDAKTHSGNTKP